MHGTMPNQADKTQGNDVSWERWCRRDTRSRETYCPSHWPVAWHRSQRSRHEEAFEYLMQEEGGCREGWREPSSGEQRGKKRAQTRERANRGENEEEEGQTARVEHSEVAERKRRETRLVNPAHAGAVKASVWVTESSSEPSKYRDFTAVSQWVTYRRQSHITVSQSHSASQSVVQSDRQTDSHIQTEVQTDSQTLSPSFQSSETKWSDDWWSSDATLSLSGSMFFTSQSFAL